MKDGKKSGLQCKKAKFPLFLALSLLLTTFVTALIFNTSTVIHNSVMQSNFTVDTGIIDVQSLDNNPQGFFLFTSLNQSGASTNTRYNITFTYIRNNTAETASDIPGFVFDSGQRYNFTSGLEPNQTIFFTANVSQVGCGSFQYASARGNFNSTSFNCNGDFLTGSVTVENGTNFFVMSGNLSIIIVNSTSDPITLTAFNTTNVNITFVSSSTDTVDNSTAACSITHPIDTNKVLTCSNISASGQNTTFECPAAFNYFDTPGTGWNVACSINTTTGATTTNMSVNLTVNVLTAARQNGNITWTWASARAGQSTVADNSIQFENGGNSLFNLSTITAQNATDGTNIIPATAFAVNNVASTAGGTTMAETPTNFTGFELNFGNGTTEDIFAIVTLPSDQVEATYNSIGNWFIEIL